MKVSDSTENKVLKRDSDLIIIPRGPGYPGALGGRDNCVTFASSDSYRVSFWLISSFHLKLHYWNVYPEEQSDLL